MDVKDIIAIAGKPGLFRFISQAKNGIVVESLLDGKRMPAFTTEKVSALDEIAIFTEGEDIKLSEVFDRIHAMEKGGLAIDAKSDAPALKAYFEKVLPEYDKERVYPSDMKKVFSWYNLLHGLNLLKPSEEKKEEAAEAADSKDHKPAPSSEKPKSAKPAQAKQFKPAGAKGNAGSANRPQKKT